jgi:Cu(I)/Ag(I) efflux system periplasmic protein CusF
MKWLVFTTLISLSALAPAHATNHVSETAQTQRMTEMTDGEVRKVDKDARKLTLRHSEIRQLDMPAMTMVFRVSDPMMLDKVKAGDKVKFKAEGSAGTFTVTEIEVVR